MLPDKEEPINQTTTKQVDETLQDLFTRSQQRTVGELEPVKEKRKPEPQRGPPQFKKASRQQTTEKLKSVVVTDEILEKLAGIDWTLEDEISDEEAMQIAGVTATELYQQYVERGYHPEIEGIEPVPVEPTTLPKVITREVLAHGMLVPEWHMVKHLPGYLAAPIRAIGRAVFKPFTRTPIEEIQVIANLMGGGPNEERELNAVAGYLLIHGHRDRDAEIIFHDKIPNYTAEIKVFKDRGMTYLLVNDFAGHYIYAWPTGDEINRLTRRPHDETQRRISRKQD
jgi:hypothetical protein